MKFKIEFFIFYIVTSYSMADDVSYQACIDKYSQKGYQPWQEWSDHYTCHRYRCEIRDGKYFIAAVGCRKPKIPENALECHEYIEDENVEFPTCCARLRCVVEVNGERIVTTRGQPGELFPDKPWKGQQNEQSPAVMGMGVMQQNPADVGKPAQGIYNPRGAAEGNDISERRFVDPYPGLQVQDSPRKKRWAIPIPFRRINAATTYPQEKQLGYLPGHYSSPYFSNFSELFDKQENYF